MGLARRPPASRSRAPPRAAAAGSAKQGIQAPLQLPEDMNPPALAPLAHSSLLPPVILHENSLDDFSYGSTTRWHGITGSRIRHAGRTPLPHSRRYGLHPSAKKERRLSTTQGRPATRDGRLPATRGPMPAPDSLHP